MEIKHITENNKGAFVAYINGERAGEMTYSVAGTDKIIVDHTEVESAFNGQGVGKTILMEIVDYARKNSIKIIPLCPFAKSVFDKNPAIHDVKA
ncbi:MAG TPA: GNAT family N-acetyltransferase [Taishania sp.]|nr:GNAT family N-acetyltransferase [Taishania sp.]